MLGYWSRRALLILFVFVVAACSGGGCSSGCSSCGMTPLSGGFPNASIVPNGGSVRVTRPGLDFIAKNAPALAQKLLGGMGGIYKYPVPMSTGTAASIFPYTVCPGGPNETSTPEQCTIDIEIGMAGFTVDSIYMDSATANANSLKIAGTLPVRLQQLPVSVAGLTLYAGLGQPSNSCDSNGLPAVDYIPLPVDIEIPFVDGTMPPRNGYTSIDTTNVVVTLGLTATDLSLCGCGLLTAICAPFLDSLTTSLFNSLSSTLTTQVQTLVQGQLCTKSNPALTPACPTGSNDVSGTCRFGTTATDPCVSIELGLEGRVNLGNLIAKISPGNTGAIDILLAAGGAMDPAPDSPADDTPYVGHTPNGVTLGLLGGALADPPSTCVVPAVLRPPMGIPIPDEMRKDTQTPWPATDPNGPDLGIALAGRYMDYALGGVYNSGLLCLGVTTEDFAQLNSGLLSVLIKSIKYLTWEQKPAAAAVVTRPQSPPTVAIGGGTDVNKDPLLAVTLNDFAVDFYIWSDDRFVRALTYTADVTIPVNLSTTVNATTNPSGGLLPVVGNLVAKNGTVTNSELLFESPATIASSLSAILGGIATQLTGSLKPLNVSTALASAGLGLTIPTGGIRKISKGSDDFLAIFADLSIAETGMAKIETNATLVHQIVHAEAMTLETYDPAKLPSLQMRFDSPADDGTQSVEYAWWIDQGTRSEWAAANDVLVQDQYLFLQGKHTLHVTSRRVGHPETEDETPADVPFLIDVLPPQVTLATTDATSTAVSLTAWDFVSDDSDLVARTRTTDAAGIVGAWSAWAPLSSVATLGVGSSATSADAEVRDEAGNVGSATVALIRGRPDSTLTAVASSCGCSTPGRSANVGPLWGVAVLVAIGLAWTRRRRVAIRAAGSAQPPVAGRTLAAATLLGGFALAGAASQGCSCGSSNHAAPAPTGTGCGSDCNQPCQQALPMGLAGAYTSIARASDGTTWVAGYNDSTVTSAFSGLYGDLVVGKYDTTKQLVQWETVDGLPAPLAAGTCPTYDPTGWRHGISDPGPDVGLWTSVQIGAGNNPIVSYYDATNQALKFASFDGTSWSSHTVMQAADTDAGRYGKMILVGGNPVIAFLVMEPGDMGKVRSKVRLATGNVATPKAASDWTFEDAAVDDNGPCRASFCTGSDVCVTATNSCMTPTTGCTPADCGGGTGAVCVSVAGKPACETSIASSFIDIYPNAYADYVTMAATPSGQPGIVVYDRLHGNLVGVSKPGASWQTTILDGETGSRAPSSGPDGGISAVDTGDVGVGASLFITPNGDWHISYVNGSLETLQYLLVPGGGMPTNKPEVVDDGSKLAGTAFPDGLHLVGDDSFLAVASSGAITITYQDATAGTLRVATGTASGATHTWTLSAVSQPGKFAGYFSHFIPGDTNVANWWRASDSSSGSISGDVAFVAQ